MSVLDQLEVLKLNRKREPIRVETPRVILGDLTSYLTDRRGNFLLDHKGNKRVKMLAFDIDFEQKPDGSYNWDQPTTYRLVDWDTWITLPIRSYDLYLTTPNTRIRIPRVVVSMIYEGMPKKKFRLTTDNVYKVYNGICAYTKEKIKRSEATVDHYIPRGKGGSHTWGNVRLCLDKVNFRKGSHYNHEVGLPDTPAIIPQEIPMINYLKNEKGIPEWNLFLKGKK